MGFGALEFGVWGVGSVRLAFRDWGVGGKGFGCMVQGVQVMVEGVGCRV